MAQGSGDVHVWVRLAGLIDPCTGTSMDAGIDRRVGGWVDEWMCLWMGR